MKIFNAIPLFLCACLLMSFTLNAQTSTEDTTVYKMSREKADSLLISLSKDKSKKANFTLKESSGENNIATDILTPEAIHADTLNSNIPQEDFPDVDLSVSEGAVTVQETVSSIQDTINSGKNRKKANVNRRDLLIEREGSQIVLKGEENIDNRDLRSVNEGTMIGVGGYKMKDQYLSQEKYGGIGFRFMNERLRLTKLADYKISRQNIVNVDFSSAINGSENANFISAFADYSVGYNYRFLPDPYFKILVGGSMRGMLGMVYNTRNGNNPMTIHADVSLNFSLITIYEFHIKKHLLAIRYQVEMPFLGMLFSPVYDQSYYEIFSLGNTAEILNLYSFNNKFAMLNHLTLDFPVGGVTVRTGYFGSFYSTNIHEIERYIISHNFMLGFVKEFVAFGGHEMKKRNLYRSAYY